MNDDCQEQSDGNTKGREMELFTAELSRLAPRADRLDRERLAFLAGQASVSPSEERADLLGMPLESRAWPAAFAGMTAVAASLLMALLWQPAPRVSTSFATVSGRGQGLSPISDIDPSRGMLSSRDIFSSDIDERLAQIAAAQPSVDGARPPGTFVPSTILTPGAWQQVIQ